MGVPIGSARDITLRALDVLASADVLAAEDTRSLRKLMEIHGVPLAGRRIRTLHDHSGGAVQEGLIADIRTGHSVAYASEAGMPLIADPGFELVRAVHEAGLPVTCAPGVSSVSTALVLAGLPTDAFHFAGFLPSSGAARRKALVDLADIPATLVFFESPRRLARTLSDAADILGADRQAAVCREMTKKFEEILRGTLTELHDIVAARSLKGEVVFLVERPVKGGEVNEEFADDVLRNALIDMSLKNAVAHTVLETGLKRRDVYQRALAMQKETKPDGD